MNYGPTTQQLADAFTEQVRALGGYRSDCYDDGERLFIRSVLPLTDDVGPGDTINGGIAIRADGLSIFVHPYTMRQVCTNGAIMATATQSVRIERVAHDGIVIPSYDIDAILARFTDAVAACAEPDVFLQATGDMRASMHMSFNLGMHFLQMMDRLPIAAARELMRHVLAEMANDDEHTLFDYMNAITATARDTRDPEARWYLEEMGGSLIARAHASTDAVAMSLAG